MNKNIIFPALAFCLILGSSLSSVNLKGANAASLVDGKTLVLYDAASGTIPGAPLMNFTDFPLGAAAPAFVDGRTVVDTTTAGRDTYAGWVATESSTPGFPLLDRAAGFQVSFTIQLESESHRNDNRAGFSIIVLSEDTRGIELGFWQNQIWAQSDESTGGLFRHGEGIAYATSTGLTEYQLTILDDTYTLTANSQPILTGPLRDYSPFDGFPDPYETPNFLFLGDNTTSAQARIHLSLVSITGTEPPIPTPTGTGISISSPTPLPTETPAPTPGVTLVSPPTPANKVLEFCPSGGLLVVMILAMLMKSGRVKKST